MRAGFRTLDVTPASPIPLAGYGARHGNFTAIDAPLEASLAVFTDEGGDRVVLGSVDTLFIGQPVIEAIAAAADIPRERLILLATHTHNAPSLAPEVPQLGRYDPAYGDMVIGRIAEAVRSLDVEAPLPISAGYGRQPAPYNVNRRRPCWVLDYGALRRERRLRFGKAIALAPHRRGIIDSTVQAIVLRDAGGKVRSVVWSFPCHPAFYPFNGHVSPDFPGLVRDALRAAFGADCVVIYLPGLAGSAIPGIPFAAPRSAGDVVRVMLPFNPTLPWFTPATYRAWADTVAAATTACAHAAGAAGGGAGMIHRAARSTSIFTSDPASGKPDILMDALRLDLGPGCGLVAMTGEVIGEWGPVLAPLLPEGCIATGYLAGPCLYIPTDQAVVDGGYEADRFRGLFDLSGTFVRGIDGIVGQAVKRLFQ